MLPLHVTAFSPGVPRYEAIVRNIRADVDVYNFVFPFGVVPETTLTRFGEILDITRGSPDRPGNREMAIRTRAWLDGSGYDRVVLLNYVRYMPIWSDAVTGSVFAGRVSIVPVHHRTGLDGTLVRRRIHAAIA